MSKDIYIDTFDELYMELLDQGYSDKEAYQRAEALAYDRYTDRLADMADYERMRRKEGQ